MYAVLCRFQSPAGSRKPPASFEQHSGLDCVSMLCYAPCWVGKWLATRYFGAPSDASLGPLLGYEIGLVANSLGSRRPGWEYAVSPRTGNCYLSTERPGDATRRLHFQSGRG